MVNGVYAFGSNERIPCKWLTFPRTFGSMWSLIRVRREFPPLSQHDLSPNATNPRPIIRSLAAVGGTAPYSWSILSGTLPSALTLSTGGQISGTPTILGTSTFTVQVTDSGVPAQTATQALSITVVGPTGKPNNAALNGNYAFNFTGVSGNGATSSVFGAVGRVTADGAAISPTANWSPTEWAPGPQARKRSPGPM